MMNLRVIFRPDAQDDILQARDWYEQQRPGLGDEFAEAVEKFLSRIAGLPELYAAGFKGVRRGKLKRFPYIVCYRLLASRIEVLAVLHGGRDPKAWQNRA